MMMMDKFTAKKCWIHTKWKRARSDFFFFFFFFVKVIEWGNLLFHFILKFLDLHSHHSRCFIHYWWNSNLIIFNWQIIFVWLDIFCNFSVFENSSRLFAQCGFHNRLKPIKTSREFFYYDKFVVLSDYARFWRCQ